MLNTYYKNRLSAAQQRAYEDLCRGIERLESEIRIAYVDELAAVAEAVNYDHPEFFYVNWLSRISYTVVVPYMFVRPEYIYGKQEIADMNLQIKALVRSIAGISEYAKALAVHDWFVKNIKYDHEGLEQVIRSPGMFSAVGPLIRKSAVCEGISKLACYVMRQKGIRAAVVCGFAHDGTPHAWNLLRVDGKCVHADITYDIGLSARGRISRKYFLISQNEILKDHILR